jgi:hypothetical protein
MKSIALLLFLALIAQFSSPQKSFAMQGQAQQAQLDVIKFNWRKSSQTDPLARIPSQDVRDTQIDEQYRKNHPNWSQVNQLELDKLKTARVDSTGPKKAYEYQVEVKNSSPKEVVSVRWSYVFSDPVTEKELLRHSFHSKAVIKPGKEKKLVVHTDASEPAVVNAQARTKKGVTWKEAVIVDAVEYSDGSKWERKDGSAGGGA